ncbi:uncharacterized protein HKW66_Vig0080180 [Vigna angularis]|uniref:RIN4 pathogenic type III effector avirulence factor Avr cleavage site domain-containing protein n=1 Tax=Phaseolus angularis TaxID=3914 RepID=A0A8T0KHQ0_PHAAN|nr:uncharacterized protein HKW66_Vig0080180 [Vigna angularis]
MLCRQDWRNEMEMREGNVVRDERKTLCALDKRKILSSGTTKMKKKNAPWLSVPQFGDWDQKGQVPDYSLDFSKIREMRKQNKTNISRASLGNEEELMASSTNNTTNTVHSDEHQHQHPHYHQTSSPTVQYIFYLLRQHAILVTAHGMNVWGSCIHCVDEEELPELLQLLRKSLMLLGI